MMRFGRMMMLAAACVALVCGCGKSEKTMPFTKEGVSGYMQRMQAAVKDTTRAEFEATRNDPKKEKAVMYKCFVQPMEAGGYSYDKTISALSSALLSKKLPCPDTETTVMLSDLLTFAKNAREAELKHGFITQDTKNLLDKVSLILPR